MKKKHTGVRFLIAVLLILLIAVITLIAWKQWEYNASKQFYDGLRGALNAGGSPV